MRAHAYGLALFVMLSGSPVVADGSQLPITDDANEIANEIVTRRMIPEATSSRSLTPARSGYLMPLEPSGGYFLGGSGTAGGKRGGH